MTKEEAMLRRVLLPIAALLAAGVLGGVAAVGVWEAVDEDAAPAVAEGEPVASSDLSVNEIYDRSIPGVVEVIAGPASGSGFVIDEDGHILTNQHVVGTADSVTVKFHDGDEVDARVVGTDPSTDVALLELEGDRDVTPLPLGSTSSLEIGDTVVAIGSPFGLDGTVTTGIVSALDRQIRAPDGFTIDGAVQTDAALNQGNSGGPLLDGRGRVVGMTSQIASESGGNVGIGYAIPIETVRSVVEQLEDNGEVRHAYLGVSIEDVDAGARIASVSPGSPADEAGLEPGDVVVEAGGSDVASADDLRRAVAQRNPGDELQLRLEGGRTVSVELGTRPSSVS
jgi:putative serine protease PepD